MPIARIADSVYYCSSTCRSGLFCIFSPHFVCRLPYDSGVSTRESVFFLETCFTRLKKLELRRLAGGELTKSLSDI